MRRRDVGATPGGRDRLPFALVTPDGVLRPIYGPPAESALRDAVDTEVELAAKLVDPGPEGSDMELWVPDRSAVRPVGGRPQA